MTAGIVELSCRIVFAYAAIHFYNFACACLCDSAAWLFAGIYTLLIFHWIARGKA